MKRLAALFVLAILALTTPVAHGDVLIEPKNNFWEQHREQMVHLERGFTVLADAGSVAVHKAPNVKNAVKNLNNGQTFIVDYACLYDGVYWGYSLGHDGWVEMTQLRLLYDYPDFDAEHQGEFYPYDGGFAALEETGEALAWRWPGADQPTWTLSLDPENLTSSMFSWAYRDADDRQWGFLTYYYGYRNVWICISDPMNPDIPTFNPAPAPTIWTPETYYTNIEPTSTIPTSTIVIIVVVLVVVAAATGLILVAWKPKRARSKADNPPSEIEILGE
jgi:hypothetical protein